MNEESILDSVKKALGMADDYTAFDTDIKMHINSILSVLHQVGASPPGGVFVQDSSTLWSDLLGTVENAEMVKTYMVLKIRLIFDPPQTSFAIAAMEKQAAEFEWRLSLLENLFNPVETPYDGPITVLDGGTL